MAHFLSYDTSDTTTGNAVLGNAGSITLGPIRADLAQYLTGSVFTDQSGTLYVQQSFDAYDPNTANAVLTTALTTGGGITSIPIADGLSSALVVGSVVVLSSGAPGAPLNGQVQSFTLSAAAAAGATALTVTSQTPSYAFPSGTAINVMNFDISATTTCTVSSAGVGQDFSFDVTILAPILQLVYVNGSAAQGVMRLYARSLYQGR